MTLEWVKPLFCNKPYLVASNHQNNHKYKHKQITTRYTLLLASSETKLNGRYNQCNSKDSKEYHPKPVVTMKTVLLKAVRTFWIGFKSPIFFILKFVRQLEKVISFSWLELQVMIMVMITTTDYLLQVTRWIRGGSFFLITEFHKR